MNEIEKINNKINLILDYIVVKHLHDVRTKMFAKELESHQETNKGVQIEELDSASENLIKAEENLNQIIIDINNTEK